MSRGFQVHFHGAASAFNHDDVMTLRQVVKTFLDKRPEGVLFTLEVLAYRCIPVDPALNYNLRTEARHRIPADEGYSTAQWSKHSFLHWMQYP